MDDVFIQLVDFPRTVYGAVVPNPDGSYQIYINKNLCIAKRETAIKHEILHVLRADHRSGKSVEEMEREIAQLLK